MEKNGLLEIIAAHRTGDELDEVMRKDKDYQEALAQQQEAFDMLEKLDLTAEQKKVFDLVITANNHVGAVYGAVAYRVGMEDGIRLRMEMKEVMKQYDMGYGDYTKEKQKQPDMSLAEIDMLLKNEDNR